MSPICPGYFLTIQHYFLENLNWVRTYVVALQAVIWIGANTVLNTQLVSKNINCSGLNSDGFPPVSHKLDY